MDNKKVGFTIGKFAPLHKGHQLLIETALKEMDEMYVVVYDTDITKISAENRANWIKKLYPNINILYAFNSPTKYGLDEESVRIQMEYLTEIIGDIPVTHFYSSEPYGEKVSDYLKIKNRLVDIEKKQVPISASTIRQNIEKNRAFLESFVIDELNKEGNIRRGAHYAPKN